MFESREKKVPFLRLHSLVFGYGEPVLRLVTLLHVGLYRAGLGDTLVDWDSNTKTQVEGRVLIVSSWTWNQLWKSSGGHVIELHAGKPDIGQCVTLSYQRTLTVTSIN